MHGLEHLVAQGLPATVTLHRCLLAVLERGQPLPQFSLLVLLDFQLRPHLVDDSVVHRDQILLLLDVAGHLVLTFMIVYDGVLDLPHFAEEVLALFPGDLYLRCGPFLETGSSADLTVQSTDVAVDCRQRISFIFDEIFPLNNTYLTYCISCSRSYRSSFKLSCFF